jgi:hypothetical protein
MRQQFAAGYFRQERRDARAVAQVAQERGPIDTSGKEACRSITRLSAVAECECYLPRRFRALIAEQTQGACDCDLAGAGPRYLFGVAEIVQRPASRWRLESEMPLRIKDRFVAQLPIRARAR